MAYVYGVNTDGPAGYQPVRYPDLPIRSPSLQYNNFDTDNQPSPIQNINEPLAQPVLCARDVATQQQTAEHHEDDLSNVQEAHLVQKAPVLPYLTPKTAEEFQSIIEFPTPFLLSEANRKYSSLKYRLAYTKNGVLFPYPCPSKKKDVFDLKQYSAVDEFALKIDIGSYRKSLQVFTKYLVANYKNDEMSTARVIFRWLAAQDISKFAEKKLRDKSSLEWRLQRLGDSPGDYSALFADMCRISGLHAEVIQGHAKHAMLEPGKDPKDEDLTSWVAVVIDRAWRIVDPHWGSSQMVGKDPGEWLLIDDNGQGRHDVKTEAQETVYVYNEMYFLTDPEHYVYSHLPCCGESWQLLARPVTMREFTEMAYLKPPFFQLGLELREQRKCVLYASEGEIDIQLGTPPGVKRSFMYQLWMSNQQTLDDVRLDRFCIMQQKNDTLYCRIYFPVSGKFKFDLFGRDSGLDSQKEDLCHQQLCAYVIHCDKPAEGIKAFPENKRREWGPGPELEAAGLTPITHDDALIEAEDGTVEVRFKMEKPVELLHHLHSNARSKEELQNHVIHYKDNDKNEVVLNIKLPESGDYALNLFAKDEGAEGALSNVCSYIVSCEHGASDPDPNPPIIYCRVGPLIGNKDVNLRLVSHDKPVIDCEESGELDLDFQSEVACDTLTTLELHTKDGPVKKDEYFWATHDGTRINYKMHFPEPGVYIFKVFAKELSKGEGTFSCVYTCLINVPVPQKGCMPFAKSFAQWAPECQILKPTSGILPANSSVKFEVRVPHAHLVTTIASNDWTSLEKNEDGIWQAEVLTPAAGEELKLSTEVVEGSNEFSTLLLYKIEEKRDFEKNAAMQREQQEAARKENEAKKLAEQKAAENRKKEFEKARTALLSALDSRDLAAIRKAIKTLEQKKFVSRLSAEVEEARKLIASLERIQSLQQAILNLDQNTMLEIRNYASPPKLVHEVTATSLVLGEHEKTNRSLESELEKEKTEKRQTEEAHQKTQNQHTDALNKILSLGGSLEETVQQRDESKTALQHKHDAAIAKIQSLEGELRGETEEKSKVKVTLADLDKNYKNIVAEKQESDNQLSALEAAKAVLQGSLTQSQTNLDQTQKALERTKTDKESSEKTHKQDMIDYRKRILMSAVEEGEVIIRESLSQLDNSDFFSLTCTAAYLTGRVHPLLQTTTCLRDSASSYSQNPDELEDLVKAIVQFSHRMGDAVVMGFATAQSASTEEGEALTGECKLCGETSLVLLKSVKIESFDKVPLDSEQVCDMVNAILERAEALLPKVEDIKTEQMGDLVDQEMQQTTDVIKKAAAKISAMLAQSREKFTGIQLQVNECILDSCNGLMRAIMELVDKSKTLQREIDSQGRGDISAKDFYKKHHRWTDGLISAANAVAWGANVLVDAVDRTIRGEAKFEELMVCSQEIAASTTQLVVSSKVKAERGSANLVALADASKAVTQCTAQVVASAKSGANAIEEIDAMDFSKLTMHQSKRLEMESQVKVLTLESDLEKERTRLGELRKTHYALARKSEGWDQEKP